MNTFEDFLWNQEKLEEKNDGQSENLRHSRPHLGDWQFEHGRKHPRHSKRLQSHRSVSSDKRRPDLSYNGLLALKIN